MSPCNLENITGSRLREQTLFEIYDKNTQKKLRVKLFRESGLTLGKRIRIRKVYWLLLNRIKKWKTHVKHLMHWKERTFNKDTSKINISGTGIQLAPVEAIPPFGKPSKLRQCCYLTSRSSLEAQNCSVKTNNELLSDDDDVQPLSAAVKVPWIHAGWIRTAPDVD